MKLPVRASLENGWCGLLARLARPRHLFAAVGRRFRAANICARTGTPEFWPASAGADIALRVCARSTASRQRLPTQTGFISPILNQFLWRVFLISLLAIVPVAVAAERPNRPPNFVFILIDDLGWADVGCFGSTFYKTPNIDRLAARGLRFTDAYAACPVCSPTRASILTGKYPARLRLTDWLPGRRDMPSQKLMRPLFRQELPLSEITLAEALKPAGYVSASIGKWHLGGAGFGPEQQGFDVNIAGNHAGSPARYFFPYTNRNGSIPSLEKARPGEYLTDRLTSEAETFIEQNCSRPFFLYLAHYAVHIPLAAKPELVTAYQGPARPGQSQTNAIYAAMIQSVDESVGRLLRKLEELRIAENTVVIFMSDNGGLSVKEGPNTPATSNAPLRAGKGYLYEGGIREPLIVLWPGVIQPGRVCRVPVSSVDFYPTFLEMAGLKATSHIDGASLVPVLKQTGELTREALYWHYPHYSNQGGRPGAAIRQGDFKLIEFYEDDHVELYNLAQDLGETNNLATRQPEKAAELKQKLADWRSRVDVQMMRPNPEYRPPPGAPEP